MSIVPDLHVRASVKPRLANRSGWITIGSTRLESPLQLLIVAGLLGGGGCATAPPGSSTGKLSIPAGAELSEHNQPVRRWAEQLQAADPAVRIAAERTLIERGAASLPLLERLLRTRDATVQARAIDIIHRIGPDAITLLADMLQDRRPAIRRAAIDILVDLPPHTESMQPALCLALKEPDVVVARDAARALGALGERAAPSLPALRAALSHADAHVRLYTAEALASIGPPAAPATTKLVELLKDPFPGVRWAACEALGGIGPGAAPAVPGLIDALTDEFLYVRICAAGALGSIGAGASAALGPLRRAASDPSLHADAMWAIARIAGDDAAESLPALPATSSAISIPHAPIQQSNPPADWDIQTGRNIVWSVELSGETFGRPVVADGVVYLGSDNAAKHTPGFTDACGALLALDAKDGTLIWQDLAPRLKRGTGEFLLPSTTSAPHVQRDRLYYVTAECQLRCLDTPGFRDRHNDGSYQSELFSDERSADIVWELDMCGRLGVFPHEASNSDVLPLGDLLVVCTSNGRNEGHTRVPSPRAPSLIAVNKHSGEVVWRAIGAGEDVLHGQWCSPIAADVGGRMQVLFGGGDGWLRAYDAWSGREIWRFDGNPKDASWLPRPGVFSRSAIVASPVFEDGRVFIALGEDPSHGNGPSLVHAISPGGQGDVTDSRRLWTCRDVGRVVGAPIAKDGLLYVGDLGGRISCLDAATGAVVWKHETGAAIWGCLFLAGDRVYVGNVDGVMTVLRAGRRKEALAQIEMHAALYSRPALLGDALYLATARRLFLIAPRR
jgi:outer membrane protein assembly factor BamB